MNLRDKINKIRHLRQNIFLYCKHFCQNNNRHAYCEKDCSSDTQFMFEHKDSGCAYCNSGKALIIGKTDDQGIAIQYPNRLIAYGYDVHGSENNGLSVKIKYCPMCGRELPKN